MQRQHFAPVDVLVRAAPRDRLGQDDAVGLQQLFEVVGDMGEGVFLVGFKVKAGRQETTAQELDGTQVLLAEGFPALLDSAFIQPS
jgi:hypothetical protein